MRDELARVGVTSFTFWDGVVVPADRAAFLAERFPGATLTNTLTHGTLGVHLAFISLCAYLADTGAPMALVLEDDVEFLGDQAAFKAVQWEQIAAAYTTKDWVFLHWYSHDPVGMYAQLVMPKGARRMRTEAVAMLNRDTAIDLSFHCLNAFDHGNLYRDATRGLFRHRSADHSEKYELNQLHNGKTGDNIGR